MNKARGSDAVLDEFIISTVDICLPIYIRLFDYILQSGNIPNDWVFGEFRTNTNIIGKHVDFVTIFKL